MNYDVIAFALRCSIQEEHKAAAAYRLRAKSADPVTRRIYLHIALEEMGHARQYEARLAVIKRLQQRKK